MSETESNKRATVIGDLMAVLQDHWELAILEIGFESRQAARRLTAIVLSLIFAVLALIVAQVAVIYGLMQLGLNPAVSCLIVAGVYGALALVIFRAWGRRDPRSGSPFAGTRREVGRTLQWIQKLFS